MGSGGLLTLIEEKQTTFCRVMTIRRSELIILFEKHMHIARKSMARAKIMTMKAHKTEEAIRHPFPFSRQLFRFSMIKAACCASFFP